MALVKITGSCSGTEPMNDHHHTSIVISEDGRKDKEMWRNCHGELVKAKNLELSLKTNVFIPVRGEVIKL